MTNKKLLNELLKKTKITKQAISKRVQKLKKKMPISGEDATYIIAQQEGIKLSDYLNDSKVNELRPIFFELNKFSNDILVINKKKSTNDKKTIYIMDEIDINEVLISDKQKSEALAMAKIFPYLYVFENSLRNFIENAMIKKIGENWWETEVSSKIKGKAEGRMKDDSRNAWHQRRSNRPIDYLDLKELPALIKKLEIFLVPDFISSYEWINQFIDEIYRSRCVVCHMNPLDSTNIQALKIKFRQWKKLVKDKLIKF